MGCLDVIVGVLPSLITAGAAVYGQTAQLRLQKKIRSEEQQRQATEAAKEAAQETAAKEEQQKQVQVQQAAAAAAGPQVLGMPRDIAIIGGVGLFLVLGAVVIVVATSGRGAAPAAATA